MAFPLTISGPGRTVSNTSIYHWKLGTKDWNKMGLRTPVLLFYGVRKKWSFRQFYTTLSRVDAEFRIYNEDPIERELVVKGPKKITPRLKFSRQLSTTPIHCPKLAVHRSERNQL